MFEGIGNRDRRKSILGTIEKGPSGGCEDNFFNRALRLAAEALHYCRMFRVYRQNRSAILLCQLINQFARYYQCFFIGQRNRFADKRWNQAWPKMEVIERQSIAYRMALVASGQGDGTILFGFKNEWDIAAGAALIEAAGGAVSDMWGEPLKLNQRDPRAPGVVAAGANLHPLLIERTSTLPRPQQSTN